MVVGTEVAGCGLCQKAGDLAAFDRLASEVAGKLWQSCSSHQCLVAVAACVSQARPSDRPAPGQQP